MLNLIDRYILRHFLGFFVGSLIVFLTLFIAVDFISNLTKFEVSGAVILKYYAYSLPQLIYTFIPFSCLVSSLFTLSGFNRSNELVAMFSTGMSLARVSAPILVCVGLLSAFSFLLNDKLVPRMERKKNFVFYNDIKKQPGLYSVVKSNKIWYRSKNILYNIQVLNVPSRKASGVSFYYFDELWNLLQVITADNADILDTRWRLKNGQITLFESVDSFPLVRRFKEKLITLSEDIATLQKGTSFSVDTLSSRDLNQYISRNKAAGLDTLEFEVGYYSKFSSAFTAFVLALLGIPFSVNHRRSGGMGKNIGLCMGLTFAYWATFNSSITLAKHGSIFPFLGAWGPNFIFCAMSVFLLVRLRK